MTLRTADGTAFEIHGPEGAPPVILIHGLGLARGLWAPHLPALSARWRVIAYDLWGHGDSAPAPGSLTLTLFSVQIQSLADELSLAEATLVGFSIGGMINRRVALDVPERVAALAILNSPHDRGAALQAEVEARAAKVAEDGAAATLEPALKRWFTDGFRTAHPEVMERVRAWRLRADPRSYAEAAWVLANGVRELTHPGREISAPTLVMTSSLDTGSTPAMARAIASDIPGAACQIVPDLKHLGLLEEPDSFVNPVNEFLDRTHP